MTPPATVESIFLNTASSTLRQLSDRIGVCLGKLTDDQIWARGHETENSVGNLVLHLCGNVRQWIISGLGGKADIRERDLEFSTTGGIGAGELTARLSAIVTEAAAIVDGLTTDRLLHTYVVQNRSATGVEAVFRVVEHFGEHEGQIVYATKNLTGADLGLVMPRRR
jgi:uncharacterized damage-inducible protein DinB